MIRFTFSQLHPVLALFRTTFARPLNLVYVLLYRIDTSARKMAGFTVHRSR